MGSSHQMLPYASNFQIYNSVFTTGVTHVTYIGPHVTQDASQDHGFSLSNVLKCLAPSQYFVGREDTLGKLSNIFLEPCITLWSTNTEVIRDFVTNHLKSRLNFKYPCIFLDASSTQALNAAFADKIREHDLPTKFLLVLENANGSVVEDYIHNLPHSPILVTSTEPAIQKLASFTAFKFQLPDGANQQEMQKVLGSIEKVLEPRQRVATLVANGGTGKTQIVLQFVTNSTSRFSNIWFFDAASNDTLAANFKELGSAAGVGEGVKQVRDFLARMNQNWLCIFDNADDKQVILKDYIPSCSHGNVIVTSRLKETLQMASPECHIDLSDLKREDAIELLLKHSHNERSEENQKSAIHIVDAFGCHALAISTAGAYIGITPTCTLENYLTHFNKKSTKILNYKTKSLDAYQLTVFDAFQLSFDKLHHPTQYLMQICAYLHPTYIPIEIFARAAAFTGSDTSSIDLNPPTEAINVLENFLSLFLGEDSWEDSVVELCQLSLASYDDDKKYLAFHPVMHKCAKETIVNQEYMRQTVMLLLGRATPLGRLIGDQRFYHRILIQASSIQINDLPTFHAKICLSRVFWENASWENTEKLEEGMLEQYRNILGEQHPHTLTSMHNLASTYLEQRRLNVAQQLLEQVIAQRKEVLGDSNGEHHSDILDSMNNLASTYQLQGKLDEAQQLQDQVLEKRKEVIGEAHSDTLTSMSNLAVTYQLQGKLDAAQQLREQVLAKRKQVLGENHPDTLASMSNLAVTYSAQGKLDAAHKLQEKVVAQCKKVIGEHHPNTLHSMSNLAAMYYAQGKVDIAQQLQEQVFTQCVQVLGKHHPDTLALMHNLSNTFHGQGKLDAAQELQEQVLSLRKQVLGDHHPDTLTSMNSLAITYYEQNKLNMAQQLLEQVCAQYKLLLGDHHHPDTLSAMNNLASTYLKQMRVDAAQQLLEKVVAKRKEVLGEHHPDTLDSMNNLASIYQLQGKLDVAHQLREQVLAQRKEVAEEQHPDTLTSMNNLAATYFEQGNLDAAYSLLEKVVALRKVAIGEHHPYTLGSMNNLAIVYRDQGKLEAAQQLLEQVLAQRKEVLGEQHPDTLTSSHYLAITYMSQGKLDAALHLQEEVVAKRKGVLGEQHPDTLTSSNVLALVYQNQGKLDATQQLQEQVLAQCKEALGEHHSLTLALIHNLGITYRTQGKLDVAQQLLEQVIVKRKKVLGKQHPHTLKSMTNLAQTYHQQGKVDAAHQLQQEIENINLLQKSLCSSVPVHKLQMPSTQTCYNTLSYLLFALIIFFVVFLMFYLTYQGIWYYEITLQGYFISSAACIMLAYCIYHYHGN
ncbi:TPR-like protein [Gymnopus androsaceus JB14]|uniref:TPR-like protein n=1 Tax=Gymnopus androsaceus JB14 TaxID=1447944 RepID=A0A6A4H1U8_9AGAR|nr:TPR-like protein [Gymnopus androsaceus JB14]